MQIALPKNRKKHYDCLQNSINFNSYTNQSSMASKFLGELVSWCILRTFENAVARPLSFLASSIPGSCSA
jgi:hypothetical protein